MRPTYDGLMRIEAGEVAEVLHCAPVGELAVTYARCADGWLAQFTVGSTEVDDLAVVHRLTAPSLREARRAVPPAVAFLSGAAVDQTS